ncbi:helix-turn-helix transcriptional regulator [Rugosimonospora acidiphila]|uniref:Helix-turn-helix transcriptional regulator n=1 Tax=Rugosimonospora acidiphila TaxID=556531 RepID=A0ABP9RNX9_9ACTN
MSDTRITAGIDPNAAGSSGHRRRLRSALRQLRAGAGLTQERVAAEMDWSLSKVIRIEAGAVAVSVNDVRSLLRLYRVQDGEQAARLIELARTARRRPWWYAYRDHFAAAFQSYLDLEPGASALKFHQTGCVPGLLQTERYARAVSLATAPEPVPPQRLDLELNVRLRRQRGVFGQQSPPEVVALLDEACLRRSCGDRDALRAQLAHLRELADRPGVAIHVVPFTASVTAATLGTFVLLEFDADGDGPALYVEGLRGVQSMRTQHPAVTAYANLFERVRSAALDETDSLALIDRAAREV